MLKFKAFSDKDLEEEWLAQMCSKGWGFKKFRLGFYTFEPCEPNEYCYQIDLLDNWRGDKHDYAAFMEETGVEVIGQWYRWVYIRKRACEGPFEMYTDTETKITQYQRILRFFTIGLWIEIILCLMEIGVAIKSGRIEPAVAAVFLGLIVVAFITMIGKCKRKIAQLRGLQ
ncbi:MAG: DUF2812 domain-containing protein [Cellulosilyticaceae bacterium]